MELNYKDLVRQLKSCVFTVMNPELAGNAATAIQFLAERLAYYEDLEEQGRLVTLPCKVGDNFFTFAIICLCPESENGRDTYGGCDACPYQSYEIAECKFKSVVGILNSEPKFGNTMFLTREEAEAAINKKMALRGNYENS